MVGIWFVKSYPQKKNWSLIGWLHTPTDSRVHFLQGERKKKMRNMDFLVKLGLPKKCWGIAEKKTLVFPWVNTPKVGFRNPDRTTLTDFTGQFAEVGNRRWRREWPCEWQSPTRTGTGASDARTSAAVCAIAWRIYPECIWGWVRSFTDVDFSWCCSCRWKTFRGVFRFLRSKKRFFQKKVCHRWWSWYVE